MEIDIEKTKIALSGSFNLYDENDPVKKWIEEINGKIIKTWGMMDGSIISLCEGIDENQ